MKIVCSLCLAEITDDTLPEHWAKEHLVELDDLVEGNNENLRQTLPQNS